MRSLGQILFTLLYIVALLLVSPEEINAQTDELGASTTSEFSETDGNALELVVGSEETSENSSAESDAVDASTKEVQAEYFPKSRVGENLLIVGTGPVSGTFYAVGGAICLAVNRGTDRHNLRCLVEPTAGSHDNLQLLSDKRIDLAIVQSDWQFYAYKGLANFSEVGAQEDLRHLLSLHQHPLYLVVSPSSEAFGLADLSGQKVNLGPKGSGQRAFAEVALASVGLSSKDLDLAGQLGPREQLDALCDGEIDAFIVAVPKPSGLIRWATDRCGARLAEFGDNVFSGLLAENPYLKQIDIPAGSYRNTPVDITTFAVVSTLITRSDVPDHVTKEIVAAVVDHFDDFRKQHAVLDALKLVELPITGSTAPLHGGAEVLYKEKGLSILTNLSQ
jgi:uncharacterized protein